MKMTGYKAVEKLYEEGYDIVELSIVYYDAIINKKMKEAKITEEYLKNNLKNASNMEVTINRKLLDRNYQEQHEFISRNYGILYVISVDENGIANAVNEYGARVRTKYDSLIPLRIKIPLYKEMFDSPMARYISLDHRLSRKQIYEILRIYGITEKTLRTNYIGINPNYIDENNCAPAKYISATGRMTQEQVNSIVQKLEEDLTLLEVIGIVPNPYYAEANQETDAIIYNEKKKIKKNR